MQVWRVGSRPAADLPSRLRDLLATGPRPAEMKAVDERLLGALGDFGFRVADDETAGHMPALAAGRRLLDLLESHAAKVKAADVELWVAYVGLVTSTSLEFQAPNGRPK